MLDIDQLVTKSDRELNDLVAFAQGWIKSGLWWHSKSAAAENKHGRHVMRSIYAPTANTLEGRSQCRSLIAKCTPHLDSMDLPERRCQDQDVKTHGMGRAVTMAAILILTSKTTHLESL